MKSPTINLLPHEQEISPATARKSFLLWSAILTGIVLLAGATGYIWMDLKTVTEQIEVKELEQQELKRAIGKADQVQESLAYILDRKKSYEELEAQAIDFPEALETIANATPQNLRLTTLSLDSTKITLAGIAAERALAVAFTENLQKSKQFTSVLLSQANNQTDGVQFTVTMGYIKKTPSPSPQAKATP